jgi:autophagy-related protein 9
MFRERINMSYPFASRYIDQFPKRRTAEAARFVAFVASAIISVLALAAVIDPELFLGFELTHDRTVLFYLGVFGTIWATARGTIPDENLVFDPEYALRNVIEYTHYEPDHWKGRLHTDEVKRDFSLLYKMKIVIFFEEILGIILTPFILWYNLPNNSDRIIDFFREFTVHVDGLGYVCSFAEFNFNTGVGRRGGQDNRLGPNGPHNDPNADMRVDFYGTKHGKMAASYHNFMDNYATNPRTGIPGHVPPGMRHQFHPPPSFPGLMSPTLAADLHASRMRGPERGRSSLAQNLQAVRTPRFTATAQVSPMPSILLDAHHQPSSTGFGHKSRSRGSRHGHISTRNLRDEPLDEEDGDLAPGGMGEEREVPYEGLDESRWETSPTRTSTRAHTTEETDGNEEGLLGMLRGFQKTRGGGTGRAPGMNLP